MNEKHYKKLQCKFCGETNEDKFRIGNRTLCAKCERNKSKLKYQNLNPIEKERVKEKSRNRYRSLNLEGKEKYKDKQCQWAAKNLIRFRVLAAKHRSKRTHKEFSITTDIMLKKFENQNHRCYITNIPLSMDIKSPYVLSIDRLDSNIGYTPENSILVNDLSLDFIRLIKEACNNL